ncbi:MAG: DNA/RNA non-specific endonuclease [Acutalibacteraceae bacterium]|jgi:DNA-entry nuclease
MKKHRVLLPLLLAVFVLFGGCASLAEPGSAPAAAVALEDVPAFSGAPYVEIDGNQPAFSEAERTAESFETYSALDELGRCGPAFACIGQDLMPTQERESISQVRPTGWQNAEYDFVDGGYLYNRCHLIGFQLTGENANERNLITGTRYMNVEGMLPFENMVADYVKETGSHVLYRVTPVFEAEELVARGVQMEAWSVEDEGDGVCFNVYVYNNQPGVEIDYRTGESRAAGAESSAEPAQDETYILNVRSKKFHRPNCASVDSMREENRETFHGSREALVEQGYAPCGSCNP